MNRTLNPKPLGKGFRTASKVALIYYPLVKLKPILSVYFFVATSGVIATGFRV